MSSINDIHDEILGWLDLQNVVKISGSETSFDLISKALKNAVQRDFSASQDVKKSETERAAHRQVMKRFMQAHRNFQQLKDTNPEEYLPQIGARMQRLIDQGMGVVE